jgi:hypothetical protein
MMKYGDLRVAHAFPTVQSIHFDKKTAAKLAELRAPVDSDEKTPLAGFKKQEDYITAHARTIYKDDAVSEHCELHPGEKCRVRWNDCRPDSSRARQMTLLIGSPLCRGFCPGGGKLGKAHSGEEARLAYMGEVKHSKSLDANITENSHLYPAKDFCDEAKSVDRVPKYLVAAPFDIGWPLGGERFFGFMLNPSRHVWCGVQQDDITLDFLSFFQASVEVDGSIFAKTDSANGIQSIRAEYGKRKKHQSR